jgi:hypothetical protein
MKDLKITIETWRFIMSELGAFNERTNYEYDMTMDEVLYSYLESTNETLCAFTDWDEGKGNDPYWDDVKDKHCCCSFLEDMNEKLKSYN